MVRFLLSIILFFGNLFTFGQTFNKSTDPQEVISFKTVKIGNQTWTKENLNVSTFRNGDTIPEAKSKEEWIKARRENKPVWCFYNFNPEYGEKYGKLYNWYAVNDVRGLSPVGFHIPSKIEWDSLIHFINYRSELKTTLGWENKNGEDSYGFSGLPGGCLYANYKFEGIGIRACWWSSTEEFFIHNKEGEIKEELEKLGPREIFEPYYLNLINGDIFDGFLDPLLDVTLFTNEVLNELGKPTNRKSTNIDFSGVLVKDFGFSVRCILN